MAEFQSPNKPVPPNLRIFFTQLHALTLNFLFFFLNFFQPKEELGFWDSAVDAVITDKAHVTNRMTQNSQKSGTEQEKVTPPVQTVNSFFVYLSTDYTTYVFKYIYLVCSSSKGDGLVCS